MNYNKLFIDYIFLPSTGLFIVKGLTPRFINYKFYENSFIIIDYWFFLHLVNTYLLVLYYPFYLSKLKFWYFVFGWELTENIIIPFLFSDLQYFKENNRDICGDIFAAVPAFFLLLKKNKTH